MPPAWLPDTDSESCGTLTSICMVISQCDSWFSPSPSEEGWDGVVFLCDPTHQIKGTSPCPPRPGGFHLVGLGQNPHLRPRWLSSTFLPPRSAPPRPIPFAARHVCSDSPPQAMQTKDAANTIAFDPGACDAGGNVECDAMRPDFRLFLHPHDRLGCRIALDLCRKFLMRKGIELLDAANGDVFDLALRRSATRS